MIIEELGHYGISVANTYSITSDSGSNIVKMIKLLDDFYRARTFGELLEFNYESDEKMNALMQEVADQLARLDSIIGELKNFKFIISCNELFLCHIFVACMFKQEYHVRHMSTSCPSWMRSKIRGTILVLDSTLTLLRKLVHLQLC